MSGIVGMVNLNGAPVDRPLLEYMTRFMDFRGPDGRGSWVDGSVGFGSTLLRTSSRWRDRAEPCSLDGQVWIAADARIDDRDTLAGALGTKADDARFRTASAAELILRAYLAWGEDCVDHLLGDFAFAIWDTPRRRLFCARDHFGVKPFYYALSADCFVFSNTLNALRLHPAVSGELNEKAIGDFLLFDFNQDPASTTFADIHRLPAAHRLAWSPEGGLVQRRYWSLPVTDQIIRYKNPGDYVDRFRELLRRAVGDRVKTSRVAISQSGGLDSTALAATVSQIRATSAEPQEVRSYCFVSHRLFADTEGHYAGLAAEALGIPIEYLDSADYTLFKGMHAPELFRPEPFHQPQLLKLRDVLTRTLETGGRVMLYGEDPDALFCPATVLEMLGGMSFTEVARDVTQYIRVAHRRPSFGLGMYGRLARRLKKQSGHYPTWLNPDFEQRLELPRRWVEQRRPDAGATHPVRSAAYRRMTQPFWPWFLEHWDPGFTTLPVEVRHPYLDLRVVRYTLTVPPLPWCVNKELLRAAMRGILPEPVRLRPKTPMAAHAHHELLRQGLPPAFDRFEPGAARFIDRAALEHVSGGDGDPADSWVNLRPLSFNCWFRSQAAIDLRSLQLEPS